MTWIMETEKVDYHLNIKGVTGGRGRNKYRLWSQEDVDSNPSSISYQLYHAKQHIWPLLALIASYERVESNTHLQNGCKH